MEGGKNADYEEGRKGGQSMKTWNKGGRNGEK